MLARCIRPKDIRQEIKDRFGISLKTSAISAFANTHKDDIEIKRAKILVAFDDIPLGHK